MHIGKNEKALGKYIKLNKTKYYIRANINKRMADSFTSSNESNM